LQKEGTEEVLQTKVCPVFEKIEKDVKEKKSSFLTGNVRNTNTCFSDSRKLVARNRT